VTVTAACSDASNRIGDHGDGDVTDLGLHGAELWLPWRFVMPITSMPQLRYTFDSALVENAGPSMQR